MTLDQRLALARDLIARRDAIDAELAALFEGSLPGHKPLRKCKLCGGSGHRSDACPSLGDQSGGDSAASSA